MSNTLQTGKFKAHITHSEINLDGLRFTPAQGDVITGLLSTAGKMSTMDVLPSEINNSPVKIRFTELGKLLLSLEGQTSNIELSFDDVDNLVDLIQQSIGVQIDMQRLSPQPRGDGYIPNKIPDTFDGRN